MLVYLVGPGKKSVHPFESDGGDLLSLLKNAVVLEQNAALGQIQHDGDHSRHRQLQRRDRKPPARLCLARLPSRPRRWDFDVNKVSRGQVTMAIMLSRITPLAK